MRWCVKGNSAGKRARVGVLLVTRGSIHMPRQRSVDCSRRTRLTLHECDSLMLSASARGFFNGSEQDRQHDRNRGTGTRRTSARRYADVAPRSISAELNAPAFLFRDKRGGESHELFATRCRNRCAFAGSTCARGDGRCSLPRSGRIRRTRKSRRRSRCNGRGQAAGRARVVGKCRRARDDRFGGGVQIARTRVVAEALPRVQHFRLRGGGEASQNPGSAGASARSTGSPSRPASVAASTPRRGSRMGRACDAMADRGRASHTRPETAAKGGGSRT